MTFRAFNPTTGTHRGDVDALDADACEPLLARVHDEQQQWKRASVDTRAHFAHALAHGLRVQRERLALELVAEMGKPIRAARAEIDKCILLCEVAPVMAVRALDDELLLDDSSGRAYLRHDPLGTILAIMPWNFPHWQALRFALPALLAGNGVLIKPAESVPRSARFLHECIEDARRVAVTAGAPLAPCAVALLPLDAIDNVIADARIVGVTLTGGERAGRHVAAVAGAHLKKVVLELGGSDPFLVLPSANVERAARCATTARTQNAGQSCIAAKRFVVCERVYEEFLDRLATGMRALTMGDPLEERTDIGPMATAAVRDSLAAQVRESVRLGARAIVGGDASGLPGYFFPPTILVDVPDHSPAARDELFGPVASVFRVRDVDEAIACANRSAFGLGASVWTAHAAEAERCIAELDVGMVFVNDYVVSDPRFPFGGVKRSGFGRELGPAGFREFTNTKTVRIAR